MYVCLGVGVCRCCVVAERMKLLTWSWDMSGKSAFLFFYLFTLCLVYMSLPVLREDHWIGMCISTFLICGNVCEIDRLDRLGGKGKVFFQFWELVRHSARANKTLVRDCCLYICLLRGYLRCLEREKGITNSFQPPTPTSSLLLPSHFDAKCKNCQQVHFVLFVFM